MTQVVLVTGGTGCIGAATVHALLGRGVEKVVVASRSTSVETLRLWLDPAAEPRLVLRRCDLGDPAAVTRLLEEEQPTRIVHLAAQQSPACDAFPLDGMKVNVGATLTLLQGSERLGSRLERFVFASSGAVYGPRSLYSAPTVKEDEPLVPPNLYGVWKLAGEHLARLFHERTGVPTLGLRLNTTYGIGRDRGRSAAPTTALKATALSCHTGRALPYRIPYRGRENYHYVADVGVHFALAALDPFEGVGFYNIRGRTLEVAQFLGVVSRVARGIGMAEHMDVGIAPEAGTNLFVCDLDDRAILARFPASPLTPIEEGIRASLMAFHRLAEQGELVELPASG